MQGGIQDLENIEQRQGPSIGDVADGTLALGDLAMNITPWVGRFFENRNRALLDADMGLGEYSFLYLAAYRERFLDGSLDGELFCEGTVLSIEVGDDGTPPPWREVVRGSTTESLAPYRDRLDSLFCPATACIELDPDSRRAMALALE